MYYIYTDTGEQPLHSTQHTRAQHVIILVLVLLMKSHHIAHYSCRLYGHRKDNIVIYYYVLQTIMCERQGKSSVENNIPSQFYQHNGVIVENATPFIDINISIEPWIF